MKNAPPHPVRDAEVAMLASLKAELKELWLANPANALEECLAKRPVDIDQDRLIGHLIQYEIDLRRQAGEHPQVDDYGSRFPGIDAVWLDDLISLPGPPPPSMSSPALPSRYEIIKEIGRGGIGSVWRVLDLHLDRPLAAKVLLPNLRADSAANARLDREANLTGSLQHPGVPPVHDRGQLLSGSSFFTMKLVEGETLSEILKSRPSRTEDRSRLLGIFEQIAQTVAFAHAEGIIHRDLKPQNVMVGRFGEVQIMDWGMAKRLVDSSEPKESERAPESAQAKRGANSQSSQDTATASHDSSFIDPMRSLTRQGDVFGTPAYMPPEQARGDVDAMSERSDVFGLGAMLFEILTASRLYDSVPASELMACVAEGRLDASLSMLDGAGIDDELVQLCKQCLQKRPSDRPQNARQVADVTSNYMASVEDRLRQAELDRTAAQVKVAEERKRRHGMLAMAGVILVVSLLGTAGVAWQWNNALRSSELAEAESQHAKSNFEKLLDAVERMLTRVGDEKLDQLPHMKTVRRALLQDALDFYQQILEQEGSSPALALEVAEAHRLVGKIQYLLGENEEAMRHNREAINLFRSLDGVLPSVDVDRPLAYCLESAGRIEERLGNLTEAEIAFVEAVAIRSRVVETDLGNSTLVINLADSLRGLGRVRKNKGDLAGATEVLDQAIDSLTRVVADEPKNTEAWLALAAGYDGAGSVAGRQGNKEESRAFDQKAVDVLEPLLGTNVGAEEDLMAELSRYLNNLAIDQRALGQIEEAEANHLKAAALRRQLVIDFPTTPEYRNLLATSAINLGVIYKTTDRPSEAKASYDEAIKILEDLSRQFPNVPSYRSSLGVTLHNAANFLEVTERNEEAVDLRRQAMLVVGELHKEFPTTPSYQYILGVVCNDLAIQTERRGRTEEAITAIARAIELRSDLVARFTDNQPYIATLALSRGLMAWILTMSGDPALQDHAEALELAEAAIAASPDDPKNNRSLGAVLFRHARYDEAIEALMRTDPEASGDAATWYLLAASHLQAGNRVEADEWFARAEAWTETPSSRPDVNLNPIRDETQSLFADLRPHDDEN